jgi:GR25 family glycosyltransferase involved in LPS biosynthesis
MSNIEIKEIKEIKDIKHAFYINLLERVDRKVDVEQELSKIGICAERFNAIKMDNGAIGCSMSHLKCLQIAYENKYEHVFICEDDITFLQPELFKTKLNQFLEKHDNWDVVLLAGNVVPPFKPVDDCCIQVKKCQTTTGYIVNGHYIKTLIDNIKMGLTHLIKNTEKHILFAIDKFWFHLQEKDQWYLIIPLTVIQKPGYSDIEKRITNYSNIMTDLNKPYFKPFPVFTPLHI